MQRESNASMAFIRQAPAQKVIACFFKPSMRRPFCFSGKCDVFAIKAPAWRSLLTTSLCLQIS